LTTSSDDTIVLGVASGGYLVVRWNTAWFCDDRENVITVQ